MPDFDIRKTNGSFGDTIKLLISVAISFFLAQRWNGYISEIITKFFPEGNSILEKGLINLMITFIMIIIVMKLFGKEKKP